MAFTNPGIAYLAPNLDHKRRHDFIAAEQGRARAQAAAQRRRASAAKAGWSFQLPPRLSAALDEQAAALDRYADALEPHRIEAGRLARTPRTGWSRPRDKAPGLLGST